jgi:hypothetical protein
MNPNLYADSSCDMASTKFNLRIDECSPKQMCGGFWLDLQIRVSFLKTLAPTGFYSRYIKMLISRQWIPLRVNHIRSQGNALLNEVKQTTYSFFKD